MVYHTLFNVNELVMMTARGAYFGTESFALSNIDCRHKVLQKNIVALHKHMDSSVVHNTTQNTAGIELLCMQKRDKPLYIHSSLYALVRPARGSVLPTGVFDHHILEVSRGCYIFRFHFECQHTVVGC